MHRILRSTVVLAALGVLISPARPATPPPAGAEREKPLTVANSYLDVEISLARPQFLRLAVDGLGLGKISTSALRAPAAVPAAARQPAAGDAAYRATHGEQSGVTWIEYRRPATATDAAPGWRFEIGPRDIRLISQWSETEKPSPLVFDFDPDRCHATLLALMNKAGSARLPAVLHLSGQGMLQISGSGAGEASLGYDAAFEFVKLTFPAATRTQPRLEYRCRVTAIFPSLGNLDRDPRLAGFRRNWTAVLQLNPRMGLLANNSGSVAALICIYEYADIAAHTPPLADGLSALDVVRQSIDGYLAGKVGCGLPGYVEADGTVPSWSRRPPMMDAYPSLLIAAADCARGNGSQAWLRRQYPGIKRWADAMLAMDRDGDGLLEYVESGNSDPLPEHHKDISNVANWWDDVHFGHADAYGNALAYRALRDMAAMAKAAGQPADAARYAAAAAKLRDVYYKTFYNPATGVLAGWKSADGKLHDYYFLFVNGAAIHYGLVPKDKANAIMDKLLAKMKAVGYTRFDLGLPGNLIPVPQYDYHDARPSYGGGGEKGFQHYENGGATGCFAYFTLAALYDLGRREEADRILFPMLEGFAKRGFEGFGPTGRSYDWKDWQGRPWGYEGFLSDNYYALLAVLVREGQN